MSDTKVVILTGGAWWEGSCRSRIDAMWRRTDTSLYTRNSPSKRCASIVQSTANNSTILTTTAVLQGHHFVRQVVQNATKRDRPIRLYICTRKPPPAGELERFVRIHQSKYGSELPSSSRSRATDVELRHVPLNLLDPTSIRNCASRFLAQETKLDVLVLNAAIAPNKREALGFIVPPPEDVSGDPSEEPLELEKGMMTNVVGTALLAKLLEPALVDAAKHGEEKPRVVLVSSELHRRLGDIEGKSYFYQQIKPESDGRCRDACTVSPRTIQSLLSAGKWKGMQTYKITKLIQ